LTQKTVAAIIRPEGSLWLVAELNAYFTSVATILNAKLDIRGSTLIDDLKLSSGFIINVPPALVSGDILSIEQQVVS
jgi:hypothetical protein